MEQAWNFGRGWGLSYQKESVSVLDILSLRRLQSEQELLASVDDVEPDILQRLCGSLRPPDHHNSLICKKRGKLVRKMRQDLVGGSML